MARWRRRHVSEHKVIAVAQTATIAKLRERSWPFLKIIRARPEGKGHPEFMADLGVIEPSNYLALGLAGFAGKVAPRRAGRSPLQDRRPVLS